MKKPNNVGEGVSQGLESVGKGFFKGVTGVLTKPLTGLANDGISGFFKGIGSGMTGLVVKPFTGILDATS